MNYLWRVMATGLSFLVFGIGGVLIGLLATPLLMLFVADNKRYQYGQLLIHYNFKAFTWFMQALGIFTLEINHKERLNKPNQFFIANHPTLIDVVILLSILKQSDCVVNAKLSKNFATKGPLLTTGYIDNDAAESLIDACVMRLNAGRNLLIFPEGTRTKQLDELKFKRGVALIALKSSHDITPISIKCEPRMLAKGIKWYKIPPSKPHFTINVGNQILVDKTNSDQQMLSVQSRKLTRELLSYYYEELNIGKFNQGT